MIRKERNLQIGKILLGLCLSWVLLLGCLHDTDTLTPRPPGPEGLRDPHKYLPPLPDTLKHHLGFGDSLVAVIPFATDSIRMWGLDASSWPGKLEWNSKKDTLRVILAGGDADPLIRTLGTWEGILRFIHKDGQTSNLPYKVSRTFNSFAPKGKVSDLWEVPNGTSTTAGEANYFVGNPTVFQLKVTPPDMPIRHNEAMVRSAFGLKKDFSFRVRVRLAAFSSQYTVMLFLSGNSNIRFTYLPATFFKIDSSEFASESAYLVSSGAGMLLHKEEYPQKSIYLDNFKVFSYNNFSSGRSLTIPKTFVFAFARRGDRFEFDLLDENGKVIERINTPLGSTNLVGPPDIMRIVMAFGAFGPGTHMVEWDNLVIEEGEIVP